MPVPKIPTPSTSTSVATWASVELSQKGLARIKRNHEEALHQNKSFQTREQNFKTQRQSFPPRSSCQHTHPFSSGTVVTFKGSRYASCTSWARVLALVEDSNCSVCRTCECVFIEEICHTSFCYMKVFVPFIRHWLWYWYFSIFWFWFYCFSINAFNYKLNYAVWIKISNLTCIIDKIFGNKVWSLGKYARSLSLSKAECSISFITGARIWEFLPLARKYSLMLYLVRSSDLWMQALLELEPSILAQASSFTLFKAGYIEFNLCRNTL